MGKTVSSQRDEFLVLIFSKCILWASFCSKDGELYLLIQLDRKRDTLSFIDMIYWYLTFSSMSSVSPGNKSVWMHEFESLYYCPHEIKILDTKENRLSHGNVWIFATWNTKAMRLTFTHLRFLITYRKLNTEFNQKVIKSHFNSSTLAYKFRGSVFLSPTKADTKNIKSVFQVMSTVRKVTPYLIRIIIFVVIGSTTERLRGQWRLRV